MPTPRRSSADSAPPLGPVIDTTDARQRDAGRAVVTQYLAEAHATEAALVTTLQTHIAITPRGAYRDVLERHLRETRDQAQAIQRRLGELGARGNPLGATLALAETVVGQALALAKGPIDLLRGASGEERLLKNAKDECATEALEIATYDGLEAAAAAVGDEVTAELARRHRAQEERTLAELRALIPVLARATVQARVGGRATYDPASTGAADAVRGAARAAQGAARGTQETVRDAAQGAQETAQDAAEQVRESARGAGRRARASTPRTRRTPPAGPPPFPDYDTLTAGQVVARLAELSQTELRTVADYERAGRNRRTVLARVDTLLVPPPWAGYDEQDEATVLARLGAADQGVAAQVRDYESRHRRRVAILEAAQRELSAP
jgi:ferritin-like metal-binding protein YciE